MKNIKLTIAYQGTAYSGWQVQKNAVSIESKLMEAIQAVIGEDVKVYGSGRTDAGVHAEGQIANFKTDATIPPERFCYALNSQLPEDIRVLKSEAVPLTFHSRYCAKGKIYQYNLLPQVIDHPLYHAYSWQVRYALDLERMRKGAKYFLGNHDFAGFMSTGSSVKDTIRTIESLDFVEKGPLWVMTIKGNGFLYNMVRIIAGTLVEVGYGKIEPEQLTEIINSKNREKTGITAPARGLILKQVLY